MSDDTKKILIEVDLNVKQAIADLATTRKAISDLRGEQKALDTTTEEGRKMYEVYGTEIRKLTTTAREQQKQIDNTIKANNAANDSNTQLKANLSLLTAEYDKLSKEQKKSAEGVALRDSIKGISDQLKETEGSLGNFQRMVGDYENSIKSALGINTGFKGTLVSMAEGTKATGTSFATTGAQGIKAFGTELLALLANPIVAIIAAIAVVIMLVVEAVKSNGAATNALNQILAPFKNLIEMIMTAIGQLVAILLKGVLAIEGWANSIMALIPGLDKLAEANKQAIELEKEKQALAAKNRENQIKDSADELKIAELKNKSRQKDKFSIQDRLSFLQMADAIELSMSQRKSDFATSKLNERLAEMKLEGKAYQDLTSEEKDALTQLYVNVNNAKKEYFEGTLRMKAQEANLIQQDAAEKKAAAQKAVEAAKQIAAQRYEISKAIQKAEIDLYELQRSSIAEKSKTIMEDDTKNYSIRYAAAVNYELQIADLINKKADYELSSSENLSKMREARLKGDKVTEALYAKLVSDETAIINKKRENDLLKLHDETTKSLDTIAKKQIEDSLRNIEKNGAEKRAILAQDAQDEEVANAKLYANGKISKEEYEKKKVAIVEKYHQDEFNANLDFLQKELALGNLSLDQKTAIEKAIAETKKKYADQAAADEIKANEQSAKMREETEKKLLDIKKQLYAELSATIKSVGDDVFDYQIQRYDEEVTAVSTTQTQEIAAIDKKEKSGLMSATQATKAKQSAEDKAAAQTAALDKKKKAAAVEKAIFDRTVALFQIGMATKQAIVGVLADPTILAPAKPFFETAYIAMGALQALQVIAAPLPKASRGMLLNGPSHAQGGIPIEAEGGEAIINKRSTAMFWPLLSAMNVAGGGVKFAGGGVAGTVNTTFINDGGFAARSTTQSNSLTVDEVEAAMTRAVSKVKVHTSIEELRQADKNYTILDNLAKI